MLIKQTSYESQLQLYLKKWEDWKNVIDYSEFLNSSLSELIKNQQQVVAEKVKIEERKRKIIQEIKKAEIKLKKINSSEDKSSFINEYILPITDELIKIKEELINLQIKTEKYKNLEEIKKSEKSLNKIRLEKVRRDLVTLKMEIEKSPLFNGSLKQLNQDLEILQEEKKSLLSLKQELLRKDKIKEELQYLEDLINSLKEKEKVELTLKSLKRYKEQLIVAININDKTIQDILNDNESINNKLIDEIQTIQLKIKSLINSIETKDNLIFNLKTNIEIIDKNIEQKSVKIQQSIDIIINLQNWRDSIWRRVISVLTFGLLCSKRSVINKREQELAKFNKMIMEKWELKVEKKEKLEQIKVLDDQITEHKKTIDVNREKLSNTQQKLDELYDSNINTKKVEELKQTILQNHLLLKETTDKIIKQQEELWTLSIATIENTKTLNELEVLQQEEIDKLNINLPDINDKIEALTTRETNLILKINEQKSVISTSCLDNFKIEVEKSLQKENLPSFSETVKPLLEKSDSKDSGIDIEEAINMIM